ncbi:MAG: hypothetical protein F4139_03815 [Gemmatimonadetes bacterium]|nr:hypothetical protein [Gemmatimonadota bacterium]MYH52063.1 hypothetical protein [Gemmatimonadota bacterium]MYK65304.1 hypothetical protein [Gemmatimonadota bacterium]
MRTRTILTTTALLFPAGLAAFAGGHAACAAQTEADSKRERLLLSAAIEEVRRSPLHAGTAAETDELRLSETEPFGTSRYQPQEAGSPEEVSFVGGPVVLTYVLAEASHVVGVFLLLECAFGQLPSGCLMAPVGALAAVALAAVASGANPGKALVASALGLAGGIGAFVGGMLVTEEIDNANPFVSALVSGLVHAGITTAVIRRL